MPHLAGEGLWVVQTAWRTLRGIEAMGMIRKGRARKGGQRRCGRPGRIHQQAVRHRRVRDVSTQRVLDLPYFSQRNRKTPIRGQRSDFYDRRPNSAGFVCGMRRQLGLNRGRHRQEGSLFHNHDRQELMKRPFCIYPSDKIGQFRRFQILPPEVPAFSDEVTALVSVGGRWQDRN